MTMEIEPDSKRSFAIRTLPWLVAAGALAVFLCTLNHWVSLLNLPQVGRTTGWSWQPEFQYPAYYLLTYPLRSLPPRWIPLGLNLFSAVCAALTLAQLARSVALLPHDRTHEQRERERSDYALLNLRLAWFPPLVAVLVCGLQLTFWEHGTNGTGEMLDLLIFAWVIRAVLEYRIDGRESWLFRAALLYGVGMTNNFAMWGFLPIFLAAIIGVRGMSFFNGRFLARLILLGLAGLSLYLLLPLVTSLSDNSPLGFWQALKVNLAAQKYIITVFPKLPTRDLDNLEWVILVVVCVLPTLLFSIRWPSYFGDTSQLGVRTATIVFHSMSGLYLVVCSWCLLDAPFSPRYHGYGMVAFLTFYYLAALSVGYFCGYFLLVFSNVPVRNRRPSSSTRTRNLLVCALVVTFTTLVPVGLLLKNLPQIRTTNGPILQDFAAAVGSGLPRNGVLLCDDSRRLIITQAWLARQGRSGDFLPIDTTALSWPYYHRYLYGRYPGRWKSEPPKDMPRNNTFTPVYLTQLITELAKTAELWYLHPSFGYYFEYFYPETHDMVYRLKRYGDNTLLPPPLAPQTFAQNESFWNRALDSFLKPVLAVTAPPEPGRKSGFVERCFKSLHLPTEPNSQARLLGTYYSRALNEWGVEVQQTGNLPRAADCFALAQKLNPDNIVAQVNLEYNTNLRAGRRAPLVIPKSVQDSWAGQYRSWDQVLGENGPYDEPGFCFVQGQEFWRSGNYRQAAQMFDRVRTFSPSNLSTRLKLIQLELLARLPDKALELIREIRDQPEHFTLNRTNHNDLLGFEGRAYYLKNDPEQAEKLFTRAATLAPDDHHLLITATGVHFENGAFTNALATLDRLLNISPDNSYALVNKGVVYMQLGAFDEAIQQFTRAWTVHTNDFTPLFYRAACEVRAGRLDAAQRDYEMLQRALPTMYQVYYGLGEVGYRRKDTNAAIANYEKYLACAVASETNAAPFPEEVALVQNRLAGLKGGKP